MGRAPCCEDKEGLKKGAWTAEEDEKLVSFIKLNKGHGSWRTLPKLAGLERCGKSCRLRWTNYLRPNIKRGSFSAEEEQVIIQLHAFLGNKWSSIASHLPGRTDNEVKNHWNTHLKKRLARMGIDPTTHLPLQLILQHTQDAANYYSLAAGNPYPSNYFCNLDEWKRAMLQRSLEQLEPAIACHLVQWELARLEAEARIRQLASAAAVSSTDQTQAYASRLQQDQSPTSSLEEYMRVVNLQWQAANLEATPGLSSPFAIALEPSTQASQISYGVGDAEVTPKTLKQVYSLEKETLALCIPSSNCSMATPETCSTSESTDSHLLAVSDHELQLPDIDLSASSFEMPALPPLMHDSSQPLVADDANLVHHDSYWNKMLNFLGTTTLDSNVP